MKKVNILLAIALVVTLTSCDKKNSGWTNFFNYNRDEIVGEYVFSNENDAFKHLVGSEYCHICKDAQISITPVEEERVDLNIDCPNENFHKTFTGNPKKAENDYLINLSTSRTHVSQGFLRSYSVLANVYKNDANKIRLHGEAAENYWQFVEDTISSIHDGNYILHHSNKYYFDVIKE